MEDRTAAGALKARRSLGKHLVVQLRESDVRRRDFDGVEFGRVDLVDSVQQRQSADRPPVLLVVRVYGPAGTQTDRQTNALTQHT